MSEFDHHSQWARVSFAHIGTAPSYRFTLSQALTWLFDFSGGGLGGGCICLFVVIGGTCQALDALFEAFDSFAQAFAEARQFARSKDQQRYDQDHDEMPGL
jgi:hypothetical protein